GESVIYDYVVITNKYVWISWTGASGRRVYMTVKDQITGERWGICGDVSGGSGGAGSGIGMPGVKKIFIDAGHGGSDPGASGNGLKEKDIVLSIAQKLTSLFNAKGIQVSHSRYSDTSVGLAERAEMANNWGADLFISIHANALDGSGS
ncbi:N-acetylmuramoyl-L-alanine amidase, partial [Clostridium perfringens]|uniref:N-acetylmuramoyl-L-alanine amidase n=1 Tax=Clostridium perfringens TaxID=1502 RepID=UPI002AC70BCE